MVPIEKFQGKLWLLCLKINLFYSIITSTVYINNNIIYAKNYKIHSEKTWKYLKFFLDVRMSRDTIKSFR